MILLTVYNCRLYIPTCVYTVYTRGNRKKKIADFLNANVQSFVKNQRDPCSAKMIKKIINTYLETIEIDIV